MIICRRINSDVLKIKYRTFLYEADEIVFCDRNRCSSNKPQYGDVTGTRDKVQRLHVNPRDIVGVKLAVSSPPRFFTVPLECVLRVAPVFVSTDSFTSAIDIAHGGTVAVNSFRFSLSKSRARLSTLCYRVQSKV